MGRKYEYAEWLQLECEGVELSDELEKLGDKFGERAIEVATAFLHSQYGPELGRHGINYDDDALIWNTYASVVGHRVGLWEEDGDTGLPPELEGKLDKIVTKDKKLVSLADQIQGECAGLKQDAGVEERKGLKAADFPDFFDAIESAVEKMGATHQDTRMGNNVSVFIPWGDGTFEQKTLFFKNGLWHWPARGKEVKKLPDYAAPIDQAWIDQQRARVPYLRYGAENPRGGGPLAEEARGYRRQRYESPRAQGERERRERHERKKAELHNILQAYDVGPFYLDDPATGERIYVRPEGEIETVESFAVGDHPYHGVLYESIVRDSTGTLYWQAPGAMGFVYAKLSPKTAGEAREDTAWAVEWINPTTKKRQIYLDDMSQRQAEIEARTLRMHHPNADVRVVRRGFESREGNEPLGARDEATVAQAKRIAYDVNGREDLLRKALHDIGAKVIRTRPAHNARNDLQLHVRFADGTIGYFSPGGPESSTTYRFVEGSAPGDADLPGIDPQGGEPSAREEHEGFTSWVDVLAYAKTHEYVLYQAPMDVNPHRVRVVKVFSNGKIRLDPMSRDADAFTADRDHLRRFRRESPRVGGPSAHRSSDAREVSSIHAEGDAVPWVRITRDPKLYEEGIRRAKEIGPIDSGRQIYELLSPALSEENQEVFLVVLCNLRQECIGVAEVHRGERSRVSVSRADILQVVTKSGADHFHVVHNHPSGDPTPSPADRKLTEAIQDGAAEVEIPCVDHVVIGMGKFYSFAEGKVVSVR